MQPRSTLRRIPQSPPVRRTTSRAQILVLNAVTRGEFDIVVYGYVRAGGVVSAQYLRRLPNFWISPMCRRRAQCRAALDLGAISREVDAGGANLTVEHQDSDLAMNQDCRSPTSTQSDRLKQVL